MSNHPWDDAETCGGEKVISQPKIKLSSSSEWRAYYEKQCREQRKEIAKLINIIEDLYGAFECGQGMSDTLRDEIREVLKGDV